MGRGVGVAIGLMMVLVGALWTAQGLGYVGGSAMSGEDVWAIIGPLVAGLGVGLVLVALRGPGAR